MCSWCAASETATKNETCADQMTDSFQAHKNDAAILEPCWPLSQARDVRPALVNRLYCAACAVFVGVLSTSPAQSLSSCTSKCALLGSCAGYCSAFLGKPSLRKCSPLSFCHALLASCVPSC